MQPGIHSLLHTDLEVVFMSLFLFDVDGIILVGKKSCSNSFIVIFGHGSLKRSCTNFK